MHKDKCYERQILGYATSLTDLFWHSTQMTERQIISKRQKTTSGRWRNAPRPDQVPNSVCYIPDFLFSVTV